MLLNKLLNFLQQISEPVYKKSLLLQKIDWLIFVNILFVIFTSAFAQSDNIGYFAIFAIILTVIKLLTKPNEHFSLTFGDKFLLIYFAVVLISVAGSSLLYLSLKGFFKTFIYLGFYVSLIHYLKDNKNKIKYILLAIALVALGESFIAFKQNFLSVSEISGWQDMSRLNPEEIMTRVYGTLKPYNPNLFGGYMLSVLPTTLMFSVIPFMHKKYKIAIIGLIPFIISTITIILTGCRGSYMGFFVQFLLLAILTYKMLKPKYKKIFLYISSALSFVAFVGVISIASVRARIFSIFAMRNDSSNSFRFNVYNSCIDMFKDNWLLGIGVGNQNFREIYGLYMRTGFDALSAYNIYLEIAVESGIFALLAFLGFLYSNLRDCFKYIFKRKNANVFYLAIALVSIIGILIHGFVDTVFFRPQIQFVFWIMIAIIRVLTNKD